MFKNVKVKKFLKNTVFSVMTYLNRIVPKDDNTILLYSANKGIWNNLKGIKNYLLSNNYNEKYKIVCGIENLRYADSDNDRVEYITRIKSFLVFLRAKHVFYTAGQIPIKPSKSQIVIHLDHGSANLKKCGALSKINNGDEFFFTYYLAPSNIYVDIICRTYLCKRKNVKICGEASTDVMFGNYQHYDLGNFKRIILWAPTFRQSDYLGYDDSDAEELLPMFTEQDYNELNEKLKEYGFRLIVKLHPAQRLDNYNNRMFSNLSIFSDEEFLNSGFDLYHLMPQVDYMIGDYSSVYLQFLLLDKPLAFAIPDFEEYSVKRGFVFDNALDFMPGEIMKNKEDFYGVLCAWNEGKDTYEKQRKVVRDKIHKYQDGNNAKRAVEISKIFYP